MISDEKKGKMQTITDADLSDILELITDKSILLNLYFSAWSKQ